MNINIGIRDTALARLAEGLKRKPQDEGYLYEAIIRALDEMYVGHIQHARQILEFAVRGRE